MSRELLAIGSMPKQFTICFPGSEIKMQSPALKEWTQYCSKTKESKNKFKVTALSDWELFWFALSSRWSQQTRSIVIHLIALIIQKQGIYDKPIIRNEVWMLLFAYTLHTPHTHSHVSQKHTPHQILQQYQAIFHKTRER